MIFENKKVVLKRGISCILRSPLVEDSKCMILKQMRETLKTPISGFLIVNLLFNCGEHPVYTKFIL